MQKHNARKPTTNNDNKYKNRWKRNNEIVITENKKIKNKNDKMNQQQENKTEITHILHTRRVNIKYIYIYINII